MSLKPFTYPLPETRFLHAGRLVYKFKIRYGNFSKTENTFSNAASRGRIMGNSSGESEGEKYDEVIRVILGNLDDLHPFSTDHFTVFPYLSKWERVSKMKFKHENVHLVPYPYICTLYLELNSLQQSVSCGKEANRGRDELVRRISETSESTAVEEAVKRRRVEVGAENSCLQLHTDRAGADCAHQMSKAEQRFEKNSSRANECKFSPASLTKDWKRVESALEEGRAGSQAEGAVQLLQQMDQTGKKGNGKSEGRSLSTFWRSIIFSPLQHLFGGKN